MSTMEAMGTCPDMYKNGTMGWSCCNMFEDFPEEMMRMVEIGANPCIVVTPSGYESAENGRRGYLFESTTRGVRRARAG